MNKSILYILLLLFSVQLRPNNNDLSSRLNIPSPNVATFNTYGNIPVSLYTGTPDITIPIYTVQAGEISVPIELKYNINNVKPNLHPGVTGLGWNLFAGGCITRIQNGYQDESSDHQNGRCKLGYMWTYTKLSDYSLDFNPCSPGSGSYREDYWQSVGNLQYTAEALQEYPGANYRGAIDCGPDEFRFNFLDYTGALYLDHNGKWVVDSDTPFLVKNVRVSRFSSTRKQITDGLNNQKAVQDYFSSSYSDDYTIMGFTLAAPDGTSYTFGNNENAIEYSIDYFDQQRRSTSPVATTWHLTSISKNGQVINFNYEVTDPIIDGNFTIWVQENFADGRFGCGYGFQLIMPVALKSINWYQSKLSFDYSVSTQLGYSREYNTEFCYPNPLKMDLFENNFTTNDRIYKYAFIQNYDDIKWNQLDKIVLPDSTVFDLEYTKSSQERLKLLSLKRKSMKTSEEGEVYKFSYNEDIKLPPYMVGHYDHLGFYNGNSFSFMHSRSFYNSKDLKNSGRIYTNARNGDHTGMYVTAEMLKKIQYPTGGYSIFAYEPNIVGKMVDIGRQTFSTLITQLPGGVRIKRITDYSNNNKFLKAKSYYYTSDFTVNKRNGTSSGILSFAPMYYWEKIPFYRFREIYGGVQYVDILTNEIPEGINYNQSRGVEYTSVVECKEDMNGNIQGYTKYDFTSYYRYSTTVFSVDYAVMRTLNDKYGGTMTPRTPFGSNAKMRGKISSVEIYDRNGQLKKGEYYTYQKYNQSTLRDCNLWVPPIYFTASEVTSHALGGVYKRYFYSYLPIQKIEREYQNNSCMEKTFIYDYNKENQVVLEKEILKKENDVVQEYIQKKYTYTGDIFRRYANQYDPEQIVALLQFYYLMKDSYLYTYPIEIEISKNEKVISSEVYNYSPDFMNRPYLSDYYSLETISPLTDYSPAQISMGKVVADPRCSLQANYYYTNQYGVPNSVITNSDKTAYFWSYWGKYPLIVVKGASMEELISGKAVSPVLPSVMAEGSLTDGRMHSDICDAIKAKFPDCQITVYSYKPYVGVTSITDPRGITTYYEYDDLGRLKEVYIEEGGGKKIIEAYDYHYQTP